MIRGLLRRAGRIAVSWAYPKGRYQPPQLPADWPDAIDGEEAIDHLYTESRKRLTETVAFGEAQESKGFLLLRVGLVLVVAGGILGEFQFSGFPSATSIVSVLSVVVSLFVFLVAFLLIQPRGWETGVNTAELGDWSIYFSSSVSEMKAVTLEILVEGFNKNHQVIESLGWRLRLLTMLVMLQAACVVSIPVVSALAENVTDNC